MTRKKHFLYFWLPVLLYAGAIFVFSSYPVPFPPGPKLPFLDEILHIVEYGILGFLLARAFLKSSPPFLQRSFQAWAVGVAVFYGFTDEIHQFFVPMRELSSLDLLCDGIGAFLAQFVFFRKAF